eukprot:TRINITY_DN23484_c0_g1_i1.p1 TRINITY_DN23484_c0_g1~~TRINITY_DN23484_c0_g1_i1.p1  ORF type:complete len:221 (+),score=25.90 TRINITY_DN23484_c0_g1_i1:218-880(+)
MAASWFDKVLNCCKSDNRSSDNEKRDEVLKSQGTFGDQPRRGGEDASNLLRQGSAGRSQSPITYNDDYTYASTSNGNNIGKKKSADPDAAATLFGSTSTKNTNEANREMSTPVMGSRALPAIGQTNNAQASGNDGDQENIKMMKGSLVFNKLPRAPPSNTDNNIKESMTSSAATSDEQKRAGPRRDGSLRNVLNSTPIMAPRTKTLAKQTLSSDQTVFHV